MRVHGYKIARTAAAVFLTIAAGSCSDANKQQSPITLLVSNSQTLHELDLAPGAANCNKPIGTVSVEAVQTGVSASAPPPSSFTPPAQANPATLDQVLVDRYQVSYLRLDGGHMVPAPFVRSTSMLLTGGSSGNLSSLVVFDPNALNQAPFAALQPQNGGVDPETGKPIITMGVVVTVFGQTVAGERVSGSTQFTVDFCFSCGGCG